MVSIAIAALDPAIASRWGDSERLLMGDRCRIRRRGEGDLLLLLGERDLDRLLGDRERELDRWRRGGGERDLLLLRTPGEGLSRAGEGDLLLGEGDLRGDARTISGDCDLFLNLSGDRDRDRLGDLDLDLDLGRRGGGERDLLLALTGEMLIGERLSRFESGITGRLGDRDLDLDRRRGDLDLDLDLDRLRRRVLGETCVFCGAVVEAALGGVRTKR